MARQLVLLHVSGADWRLDDQTRETGRRGVAEARAILMRAAERERAAAGRPEAKPAA
jgi:hypothetical protein